jgi:tRNA (guanine-N(7)-)-methyltransferase subunit TRM82
MMKIPYSCLAAHGDILFAARGGQIQTFRVAGSAPLSTWRHPAAEAEEKASKPPPNSQTDNSVTNAGEQLEQVALAPPIKKQMLEDSSENKEAPEGESAGIGANGNDVEESGGGKRRKKNDKKKFTVHRGPISRQTDLHVIILMALTSDGGHLVAVSGHDKAIWVFEHDGNGQLTELSRRYVTPLPLASE